MINNSSNNWNVSNITKRLFNLKNIHHSWRPFFKEQIHSEYFKKDYLKFKKEINNCIENNIDIFPDIDDVFNVFNCPVDNIKVVIIGQDPYYNKAKVKIDGAITFLPQAHGYSFSVKKGIPPPPSLKNIYKELTSDDNVEFIPNTHLKTNGNLEKWVKNEGVFMLNASLTVRSGKPNSHALFWANFTNNVIKFISEKLGDKDGVVFILWGRFAQSKKEFINEQNNIKIIECAHPSPLSANSGFFGSGCFGECNKYLRSVGRKPVNWNIINE